MDVLVNKDHCSPMGFKRSKVNAIRSFPTACGLLHASRVNLKLHTEEGRPCDGEKSLVAEKVVPELQTITPTPVVPKSFHASFNASSISPLGNKISMAEKLGNEKDEPPELRGIHPTNGSVQVCGLEDRITRRYDASCVEGMVSNEVVGSPCFPMGFKRSKVDAIRSFPTACGSLASQINLNLKTEDDGLKSKAESNFTEEPFPEGFVLTNAEKSLPKKHMSMGDTSNNQKKQKVNFLFGGIVKSNELELAHEAKEKSRIFGTPVDLLAVSNCDKVKETINTFRNTCKELLEQRRGAKKGCISGIYMEVTRLLKKRGECINTNKILGAIPGVKIGDQFQVRAELVVIGLHHQLIRGIDTMTKDGQAVATSIVVASGRYADDMVSTDVLIYSGHGGNPLYGNKRIEDQKLVRGNLALRNSMLANTPVRVIRSCHVSSSRRLKGFKNRNNIVYDGLYYVDQFWQERGMLGKLVFKFQLKRMVGQDALRLDHRVLVQHLKATKRRHTKTNRHYENDISLGKERMAISAVNSLDDEKPPHFDYITTVMYPKRCSQPAPSGCNCIDGCSDSEKCSCAAKNSGDVLYNLKGEIVSAKSLIVYECGPSCKCSSSCRNRVSQHGIKFPLQIFKTETRGWGVRSRAYIPIGSFICEYVGEVLSEKEAEKRSGNDEYLFDLGNKCKVCDINGNISLQDSCSLGGTNDEGFTINAATLGNVGRFINHSCSPNLYAQNVLYDHDDKRMPHVMLFAAKNIAPNRELTYDYNYLVGQVRDGHGNIKKKYCYCGSHECIGRLY